MVVSRTSTAVKNEREGQNKEVQFFQEASRGIAPSLLAHPDAPCDRPGQSRRDGKNPNACQRWSVERKKIETRWSGVLSNQKKSKRVNQGLVERKKIQTLESAERSNEEKCERAGQRRRRTARNPNARLGTLIDIARDLVVAVVRRDAKL